MQNKVFLQGRLVADPELRRTPSGISVCTVRIACDRDFKDKVSGERDTDFFDVVSWRSTAEFLSKYFSKGRLIFVEGRLQTRDYVTKSNERRFVTEVVADQIYFGDSKKA